MYACVGSNDCVMNLGHSMLARVGDVYCVAHVETQGHPSVTIFLPQLIKTKEVMMSPGQNMV